MTQEEFFYQCIDVIEHCLNDNRKLSDLREVTDKLYNEVTKPQWISVEDELPKLNSGMVIVASYKGDIDFMIYNNYGWHNSKRWCCVKGVITHWMPLPQPPKKGGEE